MEIYSREIYRRLEHHSLDAVGTIAKRDETETVKTLRRIIPSEADISKLLKDQLEIYYAQGKLRYFRAHPVRPVTRKGKTFFVPVDESQKGAPDFFVFLAKTVWLIETKRPRAKLSPEQSQWNGWATRCSTYTYFKIDCVAEAYQVLDFLKSNI